MKRLLNPKLNAKQGTVLIDTSSNEEAEIGKKNSKGKGKSIAKPSSSSQPAKMKGSQSVKEFEQPKSKLSEIIFEIKDKLLKQQQEEKAKACPVENQEWEEEDEAILRQAGIIKEPIIPIDFSYFLMQDANVLENPSFDEENLQESIQKYKQQMKHLQETNDGLFKVNRGLIEELQDVHNHFLELSEVSKEVLKRKRDTDRYSTKLEETVQDLQQRNKELIKKINDMEKEQKKAKRKSQALDGIALLAEAEKYL